jgi:hypothetical protein
MPVFSGDQAKQIRQAIDVVISQVKEQAKKNDAMDIPEFIASEIIDLVEWCTPEAEMQVAVAKAVLDQGDWPQGTDIPVKRHFSLPY